MPSPAARDERRPVARVGDVARDRDDAGRARRPARVQRGAVAGVDDEPPAALGESERASASPRPRDAPVTIPIGMPRR